MYWLLQFIYPLQLVIEQVEIAFFLCNQLTGLLHLMDGGGLPSPMHLRVTGSPLRACMRPSSGNRRTFAGSVQKLNKYMSKFKIMSFTVVT